MTKKRIIQRIAFSTFGAISFLVVAVLFIILGFIAFKGIGVISWEFLTAMPDQGMTQGGIFPAIVGTACLMVGSMIFAFPIGVLSGIYINEFLKDSWFKRFVRMMTDNLAGIPSIVFGLFGMALFVNYLEFGDSIIAGSLTLGLLVLANRDQDYGRSVEIRRRFTACRQPGAWCHQACRPSKGSCCRLHSRISSQA